MNVERKNLGKKDVEKIVKTFPLQPRHNDVIITLNTIKTEGELELSDSILDETQYVIAVGPMVRDLEPGQKVNINIEGMSVMTEIETEGGYRKVPQIKIDPLVIDNNMFSYVDDRKIKSIYK